MVTQQFHSNSRNTSTWGRTEALRFCSVFRFRSRPRGVHRGSISCALRHLYQSLPCGSEDELLMYSLIVRLAPLRSKHGLSSNQQPQETQYQSAPAPIIPYRSKTPSKRACTISEETKCYSGFSSSGTWKCRNGEQ